MLEDRSPQFRAFLKAVYAQADELSSRSNDISSIRSVMDGFVGAFVLPEGVSVEAADCDGVAAEWVLPDEDQDRVILYIHGGCFISGSPSVVREFCARLAKAARARVLSVDYRLAPEHPFPAALDDVLACYRWLLRAGVSHDRVAVAGESAGGGLVFAMLMRCRDLGLPMPACAIPISPWVDLEVSFGSSLVSNDGIDMASVVPLRLGSDAYAGKTDKRNPLLSPLLADLDGLPPLLIQVGTREVLLDESVEIADRARLAGCDVTLERWEDMTHVWHWYASIFPEAQQAIEAIGRWVVKRIPGA